MNRFRRAAWGVGDQGLSSLTNFGLAVVLARTLDLAAFGAASVGFAVYAIVLSASRSIASEPFTVRHSGIEPDAWRAAARRSVGAAFVSGLASGAVLVLAGLALRALGADTLVGSVLIAVGVTMPGLLVQDAWRFVLFADGRARDAFLNDLVWAIALVPALGASAISGSADPGIFVFGWGVAGGIAGLVGILQTRVLPDPRQLRAWSGAHRDLISRYFAESVVLSIASQSRLLVIGAIAGLEVAGAFRLAQVVLNAVHPLTQGLSLTLVPEAVAAARRSIRSLHRIVIPVTALMAAVPFGWGLVAWLLPVPVGVAVFTESWTVARDALPGMTLVFVASGLASGAFTGLRATAAASRSLRARTVTATMGLAGAALGATTGDVAACAWLTGLGVLVGVPMWWAQYRSATRAGAVAEPASTPGVDA